MENKLQHTSDMIREFTLEYLQNITNNFSEEHKIGGGGYGKVYKGVLDDGEEIALKKLHYMPGLDDTVFSNEFSNLMKARHKNIARLVGYCYHTGHQIVEQKGKHIFAHVEERVLCIEYMQNGSLDKYLSDESCGLDWQICYKIIKGVCEGLNYLHNGYKDPIYHMDLKPANILLDKDMMPKIGDFGLSRLFPPEHTYVTKKMIGTPGYMPPEYIERGEITNKFDVFSLGVIIIKIIAGHKGYSTCPDFSSREFVEHVHENWRKRLGEIMSSRTLEEVITCLQIALECVEVNRVRRPTISEVVTQLNKINSVEASPISEGNLASKDSDDESIQDHHSNKCAACYREFNRMVNHMRLSHHSGHEPRCGVCGKHCRSLDALRDHLGIGVALPKAGCARAFAALRDHLGIGVALPKAGCARAFAAQGCRLCLAVFPASGAALRDHRAACQLSLAPMQIQLTRSMSRMDIQGGGHGGTGAVALGCKMVGGGSDGTLEVCARVCVIDENEVLLYESFVKPLIPVMHYRYETTGIRPEHLRDSGTTMKQVRKRVEDMLLNGEQPWKVRTARGGARLLVGHGLDHDLVGLGIDYPACLKRDTATYPPLMKASSRMMSNSLKFLTRSCLGYEIQNGGHQHPYDDCVAAMRLYKRMRELRHGPKAGKEGCAGPPLSSVPEAVPSWRQREQECMSPKELLRMSKPDYHCWCLDD